MKTFQFRTPSGRGFNLVRHTPREWALVRFENLIALGCSQEYAEGVAAEYHNATEVTA